MSSLSAPYLHDEAAAHEFVESVLWPDGPVCPHCGGAGPHHQGQGQPGEAHPRRPVALRRLQAPVHRQGRHDLRGQQDRAEPVASGRRADDGQQEGHQRAPAAPHARKSPTRRRGSWSIASARPCALAIWPRSALAAASSRSTRPSSATTRHKPKPKNASRLPRTRCKVLTLVDRATAAPAAWWWTISRPTPLARSSARTSPRKRA